MRRFLPEIFILSVAVSLSFVGYVLVDTNKDSLGIIAVTTFIGVIVMAVSLKIAGFLLGAKKSACKRQILRQCDGLGDAAFCLAKLRNPARYSSTPRGRNS